MASYKLIETKKLLYTWEEILPFTNEKSKWEEEVYPYHRKAEKALVLRVGQYFVIRIDNRFDRAFSELLYSSENRTAMLWGTRVDRSYAKGKHPLEYLGTAATLGAIAYNICIGLVKEQWGDIRYSARKLDELIDCVDFDPLERKMRAIEERMEEE